MTTRAEQIGARWVAQSYEIYERDILAAGNLEPATCGNRGDGKFFGTLRGEVIILDDVDVAVAQGSKSIEQKARIARYCAVAEVALIFISYFCKLSMIPAVLLGAVTVVLIGSAFVTGMKLKALIMKKGALEAQANIHQGTIPAFRIAGKKIPSGSFDANTADERKKYAQIVLNVLMGENRLNYCALIGESDPGNEPTAQFLNAKMHEQGLMQANGLMGPQLRVEFKINLFQPLVDFLIFPFVMQAAE